MVYDRTRPFNDLPLLPPLESIEEDIDILKKLVTDRKSVV